MDDENLFGAPPSDDFFGGAEDTTALPPSATEDAGFTLLGEAEVPAASTGDTGAAAFVGDVQEAAMDDGDDGMGFAAAPSGGGDDMFMGFAAAPPSIGDDGTEDNNNMGFADAPLLAADDNDAQLPIILGGEQPSSAGDDDGAAIIVADDASEGAEEPIEPKEPSAMAKYNAENQETIARRKEEEEDAKVAMAEAARAYMEDFQSKRESKRDAKMATNREDEQAKLEGIEADLENDNSWQRVSNTVELTQDSADDGQDTQRMRDIFILLKNEQGLAAKVGA